jgi:hypothetical protein
LMILETKRESSVYDSVKNIAPGSQRDSSQWIKAVYKPCFALLSITNDYLLLSSLSSSLTRPSALFALACLFWHYSRIFLIYLCVVSIAYVVGFFFMSIILAELKQPWVSELHCLLSLTVCHALMIPKDLPLECILTQQRSLWWESKMKVA